MREKQRGAGADRPEYWVRKTAMAGLLCAVAVVGSTMVFPVLGSRCAPVQHLVNVLAAVYLGPAYALAVAFGSSLLRNLLGLGTLLAFPGSMFGAALAAWAYKKTGRLRWTLAGEILGTALLGGLSAYPVAILLMGKNAGEMAFYVYVLPFFLSTATGAILGGAALNSLAKAGLWKRESR